MKRRAAGTLASQLGFVFEEKKSASRSSSRGGNYLKEILEQEIRESIRERERERMKRSEKYKRLERASFLYNMNPSSRNLIRAINNSKTTRRGKTTIPSLLETPASKSKSHDQHFDIDQLDSKDACEQNEIEKGLHIETQSHRHSQTPKSKSNSHARTKKNRHRSAWKLGGWSTPQAYDDILHIERQSMSKQKQKKNATRIRPQTAKGRLTSSTEFQTEEQVHVVETVRASLEEAEREEAREARRLRRNRPQSAFESRRRVAGEIRQEPEHGFRMLYESTLIVENTPSRKKLIEEIERPKAERAKRKALRKEIGELFVKLPKIRVINVQKLRERLLHACDSRPFIDRTNFVNVMRTTGLAKNVTAAKSNKVFLQAFSAFDLDVQHVINVNDFCDFLERVQEKALKCGVVRMATTAYFRTTSSSSNTSNNSQPLLFTCRS